MARRSPVNGGFAMVGPVRARRVWAHRPLTGTPFAHVGRLVVGFRPAAGGGLHAQPSSAAPKCITLYASADHSARHRTRPRPRTGSRPSPRYVRRSALTVSAVAARSL